uniref:Ribonuclease HI large subunit n=1 Tax=Arundo donax TaxID=35708 RepID=A0A0A9A9L3_ARUDO
MQPYTIGPRTGPRPASSIPMRQGSLVAHSGAAAAISTAQGRAREGESLE